MTAKMLQNFVLELTISYDQVRLEHQKNKFSLNMEQKNWRIMGRNWKN